MTFKLLYGKGISIHALREEGDNRAKQHERAKR